MLLLLLLLLLSYCCHAYRESMRLVDGEKCEYSPLRFGEMFGQAIAVV